MASSDFQPADYSACRAWPRCFGCQHFMLRESYFCAAYNRKHFGQERVKVELARDTRPWWMRERRRRGK